MKAIILFLFVGFLFVSCGTSNSCDAYFSPVSVDKIKDISLQDVKYERMDVDNHFPEWGDIEIPLIPCNIRYDTISHYNVIVTGYAVLRDTGQMNKSQIVDSVSLSRIIVERKCCGGEFYSKEPRNGFNYKPWKECPLPKSVRNEIKEDFLILMKYIKYRIKTGERIFYFTWPYRLWDTE